MFTACWPVIEAMPRRPAGPLRFLGGATQVDHDWVCVEVAAPGALRLVDALLGIGGPGEG